MKARSVWPTALGTLLFLGLGPGTVAGVVPYLLTGWQPGSSAGGTLGRPMVGGALMLASLVSLLESFARFVVKGHGTPAPIASPRVLVVSGQYRFVRNPMYVAIVALVAGQAIVLARAVLLGYAAFLWMMFYLWVVGFEEPRLRRRFGDSYASYCAHVRRWVPRARPWSRM